MLAVDLSLGRVAMGLSVIRTVSKAEVRARAFSHWLSRVQ